MVRRNRCARADVFRRDAGLDRAMEVSCRLPPNIGELPDELRAKIEADVYRRALRWKWGFAPGDPRLETLAADGSTKKGFFGKDLEVKYDES